ncbi:MAG: hypothetical protein NTW86_29270 [Candidatus Sumerlaeota bacterium]|nr:hypothetical protein [Candidatus Sumerlaeota bacterium]
MNKTTLEILNDPALLAVCEAHFRRLSALYAGETPERPFLLCGIGRVTHDGALDWEAWLEESLDALAAHAKVAKSRRAFRPLSVAWGAYGVHFIDHLFGAEVFELEGGWQAHNLDAPVGQLERPDLETIPLWTSLRAFARAFVERQARGALLGLPTIASALNIAVNLYGQRILEAMILEPEAARHDLRVINGVLCDLHRWYRANVPEEQLQCVIPAMRCQPPGYGQICGCTCQLLSGQLYREFIAPLDAEVLALYPRGGMIHLCGAHTQHLPVWREMRELRAVQTNHRAADDLERYFHELRGDQVLYVAPYEKMPLQRVLEITGGRRLVVQTGPRQLAHFLEIADRGLS